MVFRADHGGVVPGPGGARIEPHLRGTVSVPRFSPSYGIDLIRDNGLLGFGILGSVFLVVTGAEALYADIGHFGKSPIRLAWLGLAFPALMLNYLGQGALVLADPWPRQIRSFA